MGPIQDFSATTVRHASTSNLSQSEHRDRLRFFQLLLDQTPVLVAYVDASLCFRFASHAYCARHSLCRDEIVDRRVSDVLGDEAFALLEARLHATLKGEEQDFEMMIRDPSGKSRWVNASYVPDRGMDGSVLGFLAFVTDVGERKAVEESRDRFQYAIDQGMEGFGLHDADGHFTYINPAQAQMYGYSPEEVIGKSWKVFYEDEIAQEIEAIHFPVLLREGAWHGELIGRKKTGESFDVEVALTMLRNESGDFDGLVCNCRDISERKLAEASLRQLHKLEALGQLTGGIAHDFNNLLTVILGNLDLMRRKSPGDALLEHALEAVERGAMLTRRLLTFSRKQPLRSRATNLDQLIRGMDDLMRRSLGERIDLRIIGSDDLWLCHTDPSVLENVVLNLAVNARDAMPRGGTLSFSTDNVDAARAAGVSGLEQAAGDYVRLTVADTGMGIPDTIQARIFDPFFTTKGPGRGSGLGLSMAYDFVQQSGGLITLDSTAGEGTSFRLYLPRSGDAECSFISGGPVATPAGRQEAILVVEDDPNVQQLISKMLEDLGYRALVAEDASEGLEIFSAQQADLLLTDVVLPGDLSGPELARQIWLQHPRAKIVFMSGYNENLHLDDARADREIHLIPKPFTRQELAQALRRRLK